MNIFFAWHSIFFLLLDKFFFLCMIQWGIKAHIWHGCEKFLCITIKLTAPLLHVFFSRKKNAMCVFKKRNWQNANPKKISPFFMFYFFYFNTSLFFCSPLSSSPRERCLPSFFCSMPMVNPIPHRWGFFLRSYVALFFVCLFWLSNKTTTLFWVVLQKNAFFM